MSDMINATRENLGPKLRIVLEFSEAEVPNVDSSNAESKPILVIMDFALSSKALMIDTLT